MVQKVPAVVMVIGKEFPGGKLASVLWEADWW